MQLYTVGYLRFGTGEESFATFLAESKDAARRHIKESNVGCYIFSCEEF